jgi:hypothetical protein
MHYDDNQHIPLGHCSTRFDIESNFALVLAGFGALVASCVTIAVDAQTPNGPILEPS